jgi:hypothetical protein
LKPFEREFADAWIQAEVHLPKDAIAVLAEISECGRDIGGNQMTHLMMFSIGDHSDPTIYSNAFGRIPRERIEALRVAAVSKLRPLARLEMHPAINSAMLPNSPSEPDRDRTSREIIGGDG